MASKAGTKKARTTQPTATQPTAQSNGQTAKPAAATSTAYVVGIQDAQEQIRRRAYELYLQRGGQHGFDEQDWLQAEAELTSQLRGRTA